MLDIKELFRSHIETKLGQATQILNVLQLNSIIIDSGNPFSYFEDDQEAIFKSNPHFNYFCPAKGPHHLLKISKNEKPLLLYYSPDDFWHLHEKLIPSYWTDFFEVKEMTNQKDAWKSLGDMNFSVYIGNDVKYAIANDLKVNCELLMSRLNWYRRIKSDYEIYCLSEANKIASKAHCAAYFEFMSGASEYEIHKKYLDTLECFDCDLPYTGIVALEQNASILHYHGRSLAKNKSLLLIDSGAVFENYNSDITRTYLNLNADSVMKNILEDMKKLQKEIYSEVCPNIFFPELHVKTHQKILEVLIKNNLIKEMSFEFSMQNNVTKTFFPHGLGHFLGLQVHDVGAKQIDIQGNPLPLDPKNALYRSLRYVGKLEKGMVITIEPGLYFIETLLSQLKNNLQVSKLIHWDTIEKLKKYGGIRIEDDVLVTENGFQNLTREFLPE